jgi:hypothetical protein
LSFFGSSSRVFAELFHGKTMRIFALLGPFSSFGL